MSEPSKLDDAFYIEGAIAAIRLECLELVQEARRWPETPELKVVVNALAPSIHDHVLRLQYFLESAGKSDAEKEELGKKCESQLLVKDQEDGS